TSASFARWLGSALFCSRGVGCYSLFFFSSRRRHTRFSRDWSSDVCSSDLFHRFQGQYSSNMTTQPRVQSSECSRRVTKTSAVQRSEERRVGKECRGGGSHHEEKDDMRERVDEEGVR